MIPPRSVVATWRALEAADRVRAEFGRHIEDLETLSTAVRTECHRLDGDGWQGAAFEAVLASVEAAHHRTRTLCEHAEGLRDAGVRALSDLHYTALALLDYVADAEAAGCTVADDWRVTAESAVAPEWSEVIAEAVAAVARAEQRGRQAILAVEREMRHLAGAFARDAEAGLERGAREPASPCADPAPTHGEKSDRAAAPVVQSAVATPPAGAHVRPAGQSAPQENSAPEVDSSPAQTAPASQTEDSGGIEPPATDFVTENAAPAAVSDPPQPQQPAPPAGVTVEQLTAIMPNLPPDKAQQYLPALNAAMQEGDITTPMRRAAFLAQLAHESCEFRYFEELGDDAYFHQYDPGQPNTAAGNTQPGDGPRYHGRGPIQLTGRGNYRAAGRALGLDLEDDPELAARPDIGFRIAQWYWTARGINALADAGDFAAVTRAVNGGYNGLQAREAYYRRALEVFA